MTHAVEIETVTSDTAGKLLGQRVSAPTSYTPDILVPVPRIENRSQYDITNDDFVGYDTWNCYEVSFMLDNGMPLTYYGKLSYPSTTPNIVESKSLKLYLNSFNMESMGANQLRAENKFISLVVQDLAKVLGCDEDDIKFSLFTSYDNDCQEDPIDDQHLYENALALIDFENIDCNGMYTETPELLKVNEFTEGEHELMVYVDNVRSNCRVTHQPDWNTTFIRIEGDSLPTVESLVQYLISFRNESHFHEECCEMVYKRLKEKFNPDELSVTMLYTRRGGISITPQRHSHAHIVNENLTHGSVLCSKTIFE